MDRLIEALNLARKYAGSYETKFPTGCAHDALYLSIDAGAVSEEDLARFEKLSFVPSEEYGGALTSYEFGSC